MMETIHGMEENYERVPPFKEESTDEMLRRKDGNEQKLKVTGPPLLRDEVTIKFHEMVRADNASVERSLSTTFAFGLVKFLKRA